MRNTRLALGIALVLGAPAVAVAQDVPQEPQEPLDQPQEPLEQDIPQEELPPTVDDESEEPRQKPKPRMVEKDTEVQLESIPEKARATIENQVGNGMLKEAERERHGDKIVYEVEFTDENGNDFEILVDEEGKLLEKRAD
jgi:outer membrane biosynthesis protein TonB